MQYEKQHRGYGNKWRWYYYAQSYFSLAHLACQYLLDSDKKYSKAISSEKSFSSLKYNNRDLIVPIVFNIKHGIEVFLKGIIKQLNIPLPHQEKKGEHGHDIKYLYNKLIDNKAIQNKPDLFKRLNQLIDIIGRWSEDPQNIFCKYPEDKNGQITLTQENIEEVATKKYLTNLISKDVVTFYKEFNEMGSLIWKSKNKLGKEK